MDYRECRKENLRTLVKERGSIAALVKEMEDRLRLESEPPPSEKYIQQLLAGYQGERDKKPRDLGDKLARKIERSLGLPSFWMDSYHPYPISEVTEPVAAYELEDQVAEGEVEIHAMNFSVGAGSRIVSEPVKQGRVFRYSREWLHKYGLNAKHLVRFKVSGQSMEPIIKDGSWITVDLSNTRICDGAMYLIRSGDEIQVKFLFRRPDGGIIIRSSNPAWADVQVSVSNLPHVDVIGRVVESSTTWIRPVRGGEG